MISSNEVPESVRALLAGTKYEGYRELMSLLDPDTKQAVAAVVEAPEDVETANPYIFVYLEGGEVKVEIAESGLFRLVIAVAHKWANSDTMDGISEPSLATIVSVVAFGHVHPSEYVSVIPHLLGIASGKLAEGPEEETAA